LEYGEGFKGGELASFLIRNSSFIIRRD